MFEESLKKKRKTVQLGERVKGTVMTVGEKRVILDLGDGLDGIMEFSELAEPGERPTVKSGDVIEAYVIVADERTVELGRSAGKGAGMRKAMEDSLASGLPVEGVVLEVNKGGYVVDVSGMRCFCPLGQMDLRRIDDPNTMLGTRHFFKVTEMRSGRDVVLSRRGLMEADNAQKAQETRKSLAVGAQFRGKVTSIRDFGAFVDIGGVEGLVPVSELGYGRLKPQDLLKSGQEVDVEVMRIEAGKDGKGERISLSMRALVEDPFETTSERLPEGTVVVGRVTRVQPFGAFVELVPGVEGLIHVSAFGKRVATPSDVVAEGETIAVRVLGVDGAQRRISLAYTSREEMEKQGWAIPSDVTAAPAVKKEDKKDDKKGGTIHRKVEKVDAPVAASQTDGLRILGFITPAEPEAAPAAEPGARPARTTRPMFAAPKEGAILDVTVDRIETFGVFVKWDTGRGLVPSMELGVPRNTDLRKGFPVGTNFRAAVLEVRADGKVRLSKTAVEMAEERAEAQEYMTKAGPAATSGKGFGTFADLLKAKLGK